MKIQYLLSDKNINTIRKKIKNKTIILFLDYDGTLAPFTDNPSRAKPFSGIKQILKQLNKNNNIFLNIISGRTLSSLNKQINIPGINYAGTHGFEIKIDQKYYPLFASDKIINLNNEGDTILKIKKNIAHATKNIIPKIRSYFDYMKNNSNGIKYEDKGNILTLHYPPSYQTKGVINYLKKIIDDSQLEILQGRNVIEVKPSDWHKGKAAKYILKNIINNQLNKSGEKELITIYIGDDTTDEDAFIELSGLNIYVKNEGNLDTAADYYLNDPEDVFIFLEILSKTVLPEL